MSGLKITGSKCKECERAIVPSRETCPYCGKKAGPMEKIEFSPRGIIQSYTTLQMLPEGFNTPLSMALVELEHGALILCLARESIGDPVKIGDPVVIELDSEQRFCYRVDL